MEIYGFAPLVVSGLCLYLSAFVYNLNRKEPINRLFALFCLLLFLWAFTESMYRESHTEYWAYVWLKIGVPGWIFPSAFLVHFAILFTGRSDLLRRGWVLPAIYAPVTVIALIDLFTHTISKGVTKVPWGWTYVAAEDSWIYWIASLWIIGLAILSFGFIIKFYRSQTDRARRSQARLILIAVSMPLAAGIAETITKTIKPDIPETTTLFMGWLAIMIGYAIWRYELFTINPASAAERILATITDALILLNERRKIVMANASAHDLFSSPEKGLLGQDISTVIQSDAGHYALDRLFEGDKIINLEIMVRQDSGTSLPALLSAAPVRDKGRIAGYVVAVKDIRDRVEAEQRTRESEATFNKMSSAAHDAIVMIDDGGAITFWNQAATDIFGYDAESVMGQHVHTLLAPEEYHQAYRNGLASFASSGGGPVVGKTTELQAQRRNGERFPLELSVSSVNLSGRWSAIGIGRDITERKRSEEAIRRLAYFDPLTELPNRTLFVDRLTQAMQGVQRAGGRIAVLYLDLNSFKLINDSLGHEAGDAFLQAVARRLKNSVRGTDTVARLGGDEFAVIQTGISTPKDAASLAISLMRVIEEPFQLFGKTTKTSCSIGLTTYPPDKGDWQELLRHADIAMYNAKSTGQPSYRFYDHQMDQQVQTRVSIERELDEALSQEQFYLEYQPVINLHTGDMESAEALIRWRHPSRGVLYPSVFIPIAEASGQIAPIGEWVLRQVCLTRADWQRRGLPDLPIAVNLSAKQLGLADIRGVISRILEETRTDPRLIQLELTESSVMSEVESSSSTVADLADVGVSLLMDDFGTGYSSLASLRRLPFAGLKIDKSFVAEMEDEKSTAAVVEATIRLGHALGMKVIAEGVETWEQAASLRSMGCDYGQGFVFSTPLSPERLAGFIYTGLADFDVA